MRIIAILLLPIAMLTIWHIGHNSGVNHVINDSEIWFGNNVIYIAIDNDIFVHDITSFERAGRSEGQIIEIANKASVTQSHHREPSSNASLSESDTMHGVITFREIDAAKTFSAIHAAKPLRTVSAHHKPVKLCGN